MTAPLVPPDIAIPRLPWVPVYADRLWDSNFFAVATDAEFKAAFCLWLKSWNQKPPGSLPSDDRLLCRLAELNGSLGKWHKVKRIALRHWIECDDGRLYHPVIAEFVIEASNKLNANRRRTIPATKNRWKSTNGASVTDSVTDTDRKAKASPSLKGSKSIYTKLNNQLSAHAREGNGSSGEAALANGNAGEEDFLEGWKPVGRFAPLAAQAPPLKNKRKELLRMKLMRFADATMNTAERHKAINGLCGTDPEHSDQWWLDILDIRMRAEHWDDATEEVTHHGR